MGHTGVLAFTKGLTEGGGTTQLEEIDLSWKGMYVPASLVLLCLLPIFSSIAHRH